MTSKEIKMLMKAEKQIYNIMGIMEGRQRIINNFLVTHLGATKEDVEAITKELLNYDEDNIPKNLDKREKKRTEELFNRLSKIAKPEPPKTRKEEPPE